MSLQDVPLLDVLSGLPAGHPAAVFDVDTGALLVWSNSAYDGLSKDGILSLSPDAKRQLERTMALYSHSSVVTATSVRLTLEDGATLHASVQLHDSRWIVLIGVLIPSSPTLIDRNMDDLTPVGRQLATHDWANTPLGPIHTWPQSLKCITSMMLANPSQCCVFWGPERTLLYNDAWAKGSASKSSSLMGQPGSVAFAEIWDTFSCHCDQVYGGQPVSREDDLLFFDASNDSETINSGWIEVYYTWSYIPLHIEDGSIGGILNNCMDTTDKVLSERRMRTVRTLAERTGPATTAAAFWNIVLQVLQENERDIPYVLCYEAKPGSNQDSTSGYNDERSEHDGSDHSSSYSRNVSSTQLSLVGAIGVRSDYPRVSPQTVDLTASSSSCEWSWPFASVYGQTKPIYTKSPCLDAFENRGWGDPPEDGVMVPLLASDGLLTGLIIFGLNTRRPYDDNYSGFHNTIARNLSASLYAIQSIEQELQRADELRALDRAKTVFFQNVSHELRTPLTLIRGPCDDALKDNKTPLDPTNRTRFKLVHRASGRLLRLVNSLMLFSSAEARRLQAQFCPLRIGLITADMASLFRSAIEKAGIEFNVTCSDPDGEPMAYVDMSMWEKIVFNLLSNSVKYTKTGFINIEVVYSSSEVMLRIQDTGCGIPEYDLEKVLERFHRVEASDGRSHEGTGIGLALTNELVKIHGGSIQVQSTLGRGSVFTVRLPLGFKHLPEKDVRHETNASSEPSGSYAATIVEEATSWLADDSDSSSSTMSQGSAMDTLPAPEHFTVLLAEDNADARGYIKAILLNIVQEVVTVPDGQEALVYIHEKRRPDLIVTDIMMPRLSGIQLLAALESDPDPNIQAIPVIVLSARGGSEAENRSEDSIFQGAVDFLAKPFTSTELLSRVQMRLHAIRQKQELERQVRERTKELRLTQQRYQRVSELSPVAIFETEEVDRDLITYANERFFAIVGLPKTLPLDFNDILTRVNPSNDMLAQSMWAEAVNEGDHVHFDLVFANGKNAFVEVTVLGDGRLLGTLTDQTEQRRFAAEQLQSERAKADEAVLQRRLQEAFIDIVSHELRNPLSAIVQSADLLSGSITRLQEIIHTLQIMNHSPEAQKLYAEGQVELDDAIDAVYSISLCARHQTIIASDILSVSRLDNNLLNINATAFFLLDELNAVVSMYSVQASSQKIQINVTIADDITKDTYISADPTRFCQILINLISNSCRILETWDGDRRINVDVSISNQRPFGSIIVESSDDSSRVWLVVRLSDSGPGIPFDDQVRLFTRFNDINSGDAGVRRSSSLGGTGLGLYLCKKLVELQGGQIRHSSGPGEGAAFEFFIEARRVLEGGVRRTASVRARSPHSRSSNTTPTPPKLTSDDLLQSFVYSNGALQVPSPLPSPSPTYEVPRSTMLVLIVEDNVINQKVLRKQLEKARFQTSTANNGLEALHFLESCVEDENKGYPSVVLMDLEMPILDGIEATRRIREWEKEGKLPASRLPIFAITGNARQGQVDAALGAGMDRVFIKPYKVSEIIQCIDVEGFPFGR